MEVFHLFQAYGQGTLELDLYVVILMERAEGLTCGSQECHGTLYTRAGEEFVSQAAIDTNLEFVKVAKQYAVTRLWLYAASGVTFTFGVKKIPAVPGGGVSFAILWSKERREDHSVHQVSAGGMVDIGCLEGPG